MRTRTLKDDSLCVYIFATYKLLPDNKLYRCIGMSASLHYMAYRCKTQKVELSFVCLLGKFSFFLLVYLFSFILFTTITAQSLLQSASGKCL